MQISVSMLIFLLFSDKIFGGKSLEGDGGQIASRGTPNPLLWKKASKVK